MKMYMAGIGGIGMSALAQLYLSKGYGVTGSDRGHSKTTDLLESKGVSIVYEQDGSHIEEGTDVLVYSDALAPEHPERVSAREKSVKELSYFQALGEESTHMKTVAVSGTHGKTTTTAMLAKMLIDTGVRPTVVVGSIVAEFGSNFVKGRDDLLVAEACEYRNHLLELSPEILVVTNVEWDHTDWFKTEQEIIDVFVKAVAKVPAHGYVVIDAKAPHTKEVLKGCVATVIDFSEIDVGEILVPGEFNKQNARAALCAARLLASDQSEPELRNALAHFTGTWRRFEYKGKNKNGATVYDDYAHHPTEVKATLTALAQKHPDEKILLAFHPHLFSRTRDLLDDFAHAFGPATKVLIAPIYAAREVDDGTMSSALLAEKIKEQGVDAVAASFEEIQEAFSNASEDTVLMTMGAGNIYTIADAVVIK